MDYDVKILIVDDDRAVCNSLSDYLEDEGYETFRAFTGSQALEILESGKIDAAVVDLRLTDMQGDSLILKAHPLQPRTRFLIFTGSDQFVLSGDLMKIGFTEDNILYKPVLDLSEIHSSIRRLLGF